MDVCSPCLVLACTVWPLAFWHKEDGDQGVQKVRATPGDGDGGCRWRWDRTEIQQRCSIASTAAYSALALRWWIRHVNGSSDDRNLRLIDRFLEAPIHSLSTTNNHSDSLPTDFVYHHHQPRQYFLCTCLPSVAFSQSLQHPTLRLTEIICLNTAWDLLDLSSGTNSPQRAASLPRRQGHCFPIWQTRTFHRNTPPTVWRYMVSLLLRDIAI